LAQRRGHADVNRIEIGDDAEVRRGPEFASLHQSGDVLWGNVLDVGVTGIEALHLGVDHVDTCNRKPRLGEFDGQRKPDIAEPDNTHARGLIDDSLGKLRGGGERRSSCSHSLQYHAIQLPYAAATCVFGTAGRLRGTFVTAYHVD